MKKTTLSILLFSTLFACGETTHTHNLSKTRFFDENTHWLTCSMCNEKISQEAHNIVDNACTICDYKIEFSEEENYQEWIKGINFTLNYQGAYTTNENRKSYFNNSLESESHANESKENNKFFLDYSSYELNENNNIELKEKGERRPNRVSPFLFACASFRYAPQDIVPHRLCIICSAD